MRSTTWNPGVAAVLSVIIPGLGQIYKGWIGKGIAFLIFTVIGYALAIVPGIVLHIWAILNAYNGESRAETEAPDVRYLKGSALFDDAMSRQAREKR